MYTGSFKVSTPEAGRYSISVSGSYGEGYDRYGASDRVEISVEAIHVWARVVDVLPYKTTLELAFSEAAGAPIEGGEVDLEWRYYPATWYQPGHVGGKTDASGRLTLQVRHPDMDEEVPNVVLDGIIRRGNVTQTFQGEIWVQGFQRWCSAASFELDVAVQTPQPLPLGERVTLEHTATVNGTPVAGGEIFVYVWDYHAIYYVGSAVTDDQGRFSIPLDVPSSLPGGSRHVFAYAWYQLDLDGQMRRDVKILTLGDYSRWDRFDLALDPAATLSVEPYAVNGSLSASLRHDAADGTDEVAYLLWGIGSVPDWTDFANLDWESWDHNSPNALRMVPLNWSGGFYEGAIVLPEFLTASTELFVYGVINFTDEGDDARSIALRGGLRPLVTNLPPSVEVVTPVSGESYWGTIACSGSSSDDRSVARVETRVDGGEWALVMGTSAWSMALDAVFLGEGSHTLEARAFDGYLHSEVVTVEFDVYQPEDEPQHLVDDPFPVLVLPVLVAMVVLLAVAVRRRSS